MLVENRSCCCKKKKNSAAKDLGNQSETARVLMETNAAVTDVPKQGQLSVGELVQESHGL